MKTLIIGPSGSGKTYLSQYFKRAGINAIDADTVFGLSGWFDKDGVEVQYPKDANEDFLNNHEFLWNKEFLRELLSKETEIYLFGLAGNVFDTVDLFDKVYFLDVEPRVLAENLRHPSRKNPMGRTDYQLENALRYAEEIKNTAKKLGLKLINTLDKSPQQILVEIQA